jgi:hypothetical protein
VSEQISNEDLELKHIPGARASWEQIERFALTFNGYDELGMDACAQLASEGNLRTLTELRAVLFFEQRRWRNFGDAPDAAAIKKIRDLLARIRQAVPA